MNPCFWRSSLIAVVGLAGWLAGGVRSPSEKAGTVAGTTTVSAEGQDGENDRLRALLHGDGTGEPSFIDACLRMLAAMEKAGAREMEKARGLLEDERFRAIAEGAILESWIETEPSAALEWAHPPPGYL